MPVPADLNITEQQASSIRQYLERLDKRPDINIIFAGKQSTGKDGIGIRMIWNHDQLPEEYDPTTEEPSYRKVVTIQDKPVLLECHTCPIPVNETSPITTILDARSKDADAIMYVYSVCDRSSFDLVAATHDRLFGGAQAKQAQKYFFVAANKTDLPEHEWKVSLEQGKEFSTSINADFFAISAKTGLGCTSDDADALATRIVLGQAEEVNKLTAAAENSNRRHSVFNWAMRRFRASKTSHNPRSS